MRSSGGIADIAAITTITIAAAFVAACGAPVGTARTTAAATNEKQHQQLAIPNPFPARDALEKIAISATKPLPERHVVSVQELRVNPNEAVADGVAEKELAKGNTDLRFTKELRCVAREVGRVLLEQGGEPDERGRRFIIGACGLLSSSIMMYSLKAEVSPKATDATLMGMMKSKLHLPDDFRTKQSGAWFSRKGKNAVVTVVAGKAEGTFSISPVDAASGRATVTGSTGPGVEKVLALVNQGKDGVTRCEPDRAVAIPEFKFTCALVDTDPWAWIEIVTQGSGRMLMHSEGLALARRDDKAPVELSSSRSKRAAPTPAPADVDAALLEGVNRVRASAGLPELTLATKQSATNARLATPFFASELAQDRANDEIALGLLAGWEVEGGNGSMIRSGHFFGALLSGASAVPSWLDYALDLPSGRFSMLDPNARQIAIGTAPPGNVGGLGVLITTYSFFGGENREANNARVFARLAQERAARQLPPPVSLGVLPSLVAEAKLVPTGQRKPVEVVDAALQSEVLRLHRSLRSWVSVTNDLDHIKLPAELIAANGPREVSVEVTYFKPPNAPWGFYVIYFVAPQ